MNLNKCWILLEGAKAPSFLLQICKNINAKMQKYNVNCENGENVGVYVAAKGTMRLAEFHRHRPRYRIKN
jgi:Tfp pilus tip-associated adhesin PilY1